MLNFSGFLNVKRYTALICSAFAGGIFFVSGGGNLISFLPSLLVFSVLFIVIFILLAKAEESGLSPYKIILVVLIAAVSFSAGALRYEQYEKSHLDTLAPFEGTHSYIYGTVRTEPKPSQSGYSRGTTLDVYKIENSSGVFDVSGRITLYFSDAEGDVRVGDSVYGIASLNLVPTYDDFDYRRYMKQKEIFYSAYSGYIHFDRGHTEPFSVKGFVTDIGRRINSSIVSAVDKNFEGDEELGAILKGILVGDKTDFSDELREDFSKAGISHIIAVSGMHVSILFSALLLIFGLARVKKRIVCLITIPLLVIFAAAASFTPSVCRAVIMLILFLLSYITRRNPDSITSVFFAGGVMLAINPNYLFSVSFLLSFSSVLAILCLATPLAEKFSLMTKIPYAGRYLQASVSVSLSSFLGVCIPVAYFFNIASLSSILVNLWVVPLVYIVFCGGYLMWGVGLICPPAAHLIKYLIKIPLIIIKSTSAYFSEVPFLAFDVPTPPAWFMCIYFGFLLALYIILTSRAAKNS